MGSVNGTIYRATTAERIGDQLPFLGDAQFSRADDLTGSNCLAHYLGGLAELVEVTVIEWKLAKVSVRSCRVGTAQHAELGAAVCHLSPD